MKIVSFVRERKSEIWKTTDSFLVEDYVENAEEAMRAAVKDFMNTTEGQNSVKNACGDFNWGDVMNDITDECLMAHGLQRCNKDINTIFINQDEILNPEIQDKILNL